MEAIVAKILVVDDEPGIIRFVRRALESDGHTVFVAHDGAQGLQLNSEHHPDLVVLDLLMPGVGGFGVLAAIMIDRPSTRVLVLSAVSDVETRVRCLELGAADYLVKPFAIAELLARVHSRLREPGPAPERHHYGELRFGELRLDQRVRRLYWADGGINLSHREFTLIQHLMQHAGNVCTRTELLSEVWGFAFDPGSNVVDVTIARLRAKIQGAKIETVRNVGYALRLA
jgi:DNA-binding response OmpR family regulator